MKEIDYAKFIDKYNYFGHDQEPKCTHPTCDNARLFASEKIF